MLSFLPAGFDGIEQDDNDNNLSWKQFHEGAYRN